MDVEEWGQVAIINMLTRYARTQFPDPKTCLVSLLLLLRIQRSSGFYGPVFFTEINSFRAFYLNTLRNIDKLLKRPSIKRLFGFVHSFLWIFLLSPGTRMVDCENFDVLCS